MKVLYYDCFSGISGDMNIGAMLDLGVDKDILLNNIGRLDIDDEFNIDIRREKRCGITGIRFDVVVTDKKVHHRNLEDIKEIIMSAKFNEFVEATSINIFRRVAEAESIVHDVPLEEVHFHEVGATDSIIDIVGAALCMDSIGVHKVLSSPLELGSGFIECAHGRLPVPAPATTEILKGVPVKSGSVEFEATTPTGAAIISEFADKYTDNIGFAVESIGYGVGKMEGKVPNLLRAMIGEMDPMDLETAVLLEFNIDDMNPELYDNAMEELFEAGASDVFFTPIIMKKTRPATKVSVLVHPKAESKVTDVIFTETTTLGIRRQNINKYALYRDERILRTRFGTVRLKQSYLHGRIIKTKPEYEDCKLLARANGVPIRMIYEDVERLIGDESKR